MALRRLPDTRRRCPYCGGLIGLTDRGTFRIHWVGKVRKVCTGSSQTPRRKNLLTE